MHSRILFTISRQPTIYKDSTIKFYASLKLLSQPFLGDGSFLFILSVFFNVYSEQDGWLYELELFTVGGETY